MSKTCLTIKSAPRNKVYVDADSYTDVYSIKRSVANRCLIFPYQPLVIACYLMCEEEGVTTTPDQNGPVDIPFYALSAFGRRLTYLPRSVPRLLRQTTHFVLYLFFVVILYTHIIIIILILINKC